ncbi:phycobilisome rod-core linker polypeptide [Chamaesiphon sp. VAR_48_metabat_135_sub]|uniref:phycobilisome rod-core linker polypeptide n=1 Tax=Chamaesiphon sp. VAR_48_metabat_135_sub TaxID=2964699 RepID=UPI00286A51E0|nr:phycobilisome rod-core linker polypeptide [Chamaesiphon sp. VAR_48_metabat_135_sub]
MVSTFAKNPVWMSLDDDNSAVDVLINNVYRQVLGNAYVMESERLVVPESQLRSREISVREFVRLVAKSELYRSKFFDSCYRYRAIELNFKHLLGRAPADFDEMRAHSNILDYGGHDAEIDSYIESDEYQDAYGEMVVPFERGFSTQMGLSMQAVTNMRSLQRGAASSDKDLRTGNRPKLQQVLIYNYVGPTQFTDVNALMANLFKRSDVAVPVYVPQVVPSVATPQSELRDSTQAQIDALRPMANIGAAIVSNGSSASTGNDSPSAQLAEARALASVAEYRLNKWRIRSY